MAFIHELAKFGDFLLLSEFSGLARGLEVNDALSLGKHVHCPLPEEELSILRLDLVDVGNISHQVPTVVSVAVTFDLLRCVSTFSELVTGQLEHSLERLVHGRLELLECEHGSVIEVCFDSGPLRKNGDSEATLDNALVVAGAHGQDLGRRRQRVGDDKRD